LARVSPKRLRGRKSAETLSTLRRVSDAFDERQQAGSEGVTKLKGTGRIRPPPERVIRSDGTSTFASVSSDAASTGDAAAAVTKEPDREQVAAALDALMDRDRTPSTSAPPAKPEESSASPTPPASETTSGLLAAKRRARQRMDEGDSSNPRD
jgi:hypothetical protein